MAGVVDLPRATAMGGAHAAIATGSHALTVNPAGIPQQRWYHTEVDGLYDPHFPAEALKVSVVDTTTTAVGTGCCSRAGEADRSRDVARHGMRGLPIRTRSPASTVVRSDHDVSSRWCRSVRVEVPLC